MKYTFQALAAIFLAFSLMACDNIVIPGDGDRDPGNGGSTDTTEPGGGSTAESNYVISMSGTVRNAFGQPTAAPEGSSVVISWAGNNLTTFIFGQGSFNADRTEWSIDITLPPLPDEGLFEFLSNPGARFGIGTPAILEGEYDDGTVLQDPPVYLGYLSSNSQVIYNNGDLPADGSAAWLNEFPVGYGIGTAAFSGWIPLEQEEYTFILRR